jgi:hypothetical protein
MDTSLIVAVPDDQTSLSMFNVAAIECLRLAAEEVAWLTGRG